ncbi:BTB/POZ protein [Phycomyces blakesleeanus]|uniref:BTB/POZ protein n=1 Tax=Phycomyces blakesleeanus TaxID=4837 RepID=A0ABR3B1S2_PHYBL
MTSQLEKLCALEDKFEKMSGDFHGKVEGAYDQLSTELDGWQDILEADQDRHTHEKAVIHQVWRLQEERIKLNVGGQYFETSLSTLRRDPNSMLAAMFSGNGMISRDPDGSYFIDRDSTYFRLVLNYLRDLRIPPSVQEDSKIMEELMQEAMFYRIKDLLKLRWANLSVITQEGLWKVYPVESTRTLLHFVDKDLSNLDFSGYRLDSRSCFSGCNLENSSFGSAWFIADAEHAMDFTNSFMWGTQFPALGSAQRPFGVQIRFDGAVVDEMIA